MSGEPGAETKYCSNCKKDIAAANFTMHEVHCRRHLVLCEHCKDPVPRTEMEQHFNEVHAKVPCAQCNLQLEKDHMDQHLESECPKRQATCQFCELHLPQCNLNEHVEFCGTRTEACPRCGNFIMHKDLQQHNNTNCAYPEPAPRPPSPRLQQNGGTRNAGRGGRGNTRNNTGFPRGDLFGFRNLEDSFDPFEFEEIRRAIEEDDGPEMMHSFLQSDSDASAAAAAPSPQRGRGRGRSQDSGGGWRVRREEQNRSNLSRGGGGGPRGGGRGRQTGINERQMGINEIPVDNRGGDGRSDEEMIPCEFCGETFPLMALVHHQSVCDPLASTLWGSGHHHQGAPLSVFGRNNNENDMMNQWRPTPTAARPPTIPVINNLMPTQEQGSRGSNRVTQHLNDTGDTPFPMDSLEGTMLPCEFCYELLPADSLVQHQAMCEGKPNTPRVSTPSAAQPSSAFPHPHGSGGQRQTFFPTTSTSGTARPTRQYNTDPTGELLAAMNQRGGQDNSSGIGGPPRGGAGPGGQQNQRQRKRHNVPRGSTTTSNISPNMGRPGPSVVTQIRASPSPTHFNRRDGRDDTHDINLHNRRGSRQSQDSTSSRTRNTLNSLLNDAPQDPPPRQPAPRNAQGSRRRGPPNLNVLGANVLGSNAMNTGGYDMSTGVSARTVNQEMQQQDQRRQRPRGTGGLGGGEGNAGNRRPQRERGDHVFNGASNIRPAPSTFRRNQSDRQNDPRE